MRFEEKVWHKCKRIPKGKVSTYKEIAKALKTKAYRAVGNALRKNPYGAWDSKRRKRLRRKNFLVT
jgi:methylated-DNA-[protein]-cysteine S-methyltransferase